MIDRLQDAIPPWAALHLQTPEEVAVSEAAYAEELANTPEPNLCTACEQRTLKNLDGTPRAWLLTIVEGCASFACPTPGCEGGGPGDWQDDVMDLLTWADDAKPIPVTVAVQSDCGDLGGYHYNGRCDHDWWYGITPVLDEEK